MLNVIIIIQGGPIKTVHFCSHYKYNVAPIQCKREVFTHYCGLLLCQVDILSTPVEEPTDAHRSFVTALQTKLDALQMQVYASGF